MAAHLGGKEAVEALIQLLHSAGQTAHFKGCHQCVRINGQTLQPAQGTLGRFHQTGGQRRSLRIRCCQIAFQRLALLGRHRPHTGLGRLALQTTAQSSVPLGQNRIQPLIQPGQELGRGLAARLHRTKVAAGTGGRIGQQPRMILPASFDGVDGAGPIVQFGPVENVNPGQLLQLLHPAILLDADAPPDANLFRFA